MDQLLKFISNLNTAQRAVIIGGFSLLFILLVGFLVFSSINAEDKKLNYTIASNLTKSQVMLASDELEASGILFAVSGTGNSLTLKTSKEFINIAKIKLVTSEAATSQHVGWEIFEKSSLGTTNFENKVKYLRALEGELSRSLESLNGVLRASVKIAIPKDTIFTEKRGDTTASVMVSLKPGIFLTQKQIDGIKNFIASAVPDLKHENIQLIDQDGSLLEQSPEEINNLKSTTQNKYKEGLEEDYSKKIVALLEPFVGVGRVVAKVTVSLDFVKKDVEEEIYNPEGTIRSQQVIENSSKSQGMPSNNGGVAGVDSNIQQPATSTGNNNIASNNEGTNTVTNYEISKKIISQKDNNYTNIKRITAAVTFDSSVLKDINKDDFITSLESVVQDTIGFDKARGDKITVKDFKFIGVKPIEQISQTLDKDGNAIIVGDESTDTVAMIKSILRDFSEYIQYLIAAILLFIFYRKFIASNEVVILGDGTRKSVDGTDENLVKDMLTDYENEFDSSTAQGRLKSKVKSQILNNIEGLDEESAARYEVFIEELDKDINTNPLEVARMIELLLNEGSGTFK
ncbi:flagellar inner membrane MS-ring protein FliF [Arcobacter venerupis]|uniref:Flagellar M-ring protein n=1 Tax=Arcobacter venerupis TaxID=1054033 RepID=A0AAE7BCV6_9BACT|nr:flagellar basal-body MS-ring/collar protein FliF [Arcobacter venerupis]QKF68072.1 flagellar inner membrane MS-ring protein FliF [Arcobacter venerupis]RWS48826.1 flagellar M-ring protein FliF [Arcobacter venerupis]